MSLPQLDPSLAQISSEVVLVCAIVGRIALTRLSEFQPYTRCLCKPTNGEMCTCTHTPVARHVPEQRRTYGVGGRRGRPFISPGPLRLGTGKTNGSNASRSPLPLSSLSRRRKGSGYRQN